MISRHDFLSNDLHVSLHVSLYILLYVSLYDFLLNDLHVSSSWLSIKKIIIIINSYTLVTLIKPIHERLYAIYIEWTKLSVIENHSLSIRLLRAVKTIIIRLCIKLVRVDRTLENEWLSHFKLLQKLRFHHHSRSCSEILRDSDDYSIVQEVDVS